MARPIDENGHLTLTTHAENRLAERAIPVSDVELALKYGRRVWTRGAQVFVLGRRELESCEHPHPSKIEGLQVVCSPDGAVVTVYRNRKLRNLRPRSRRPHFCKAA